VAAARLRRPLRLLLGLALVLVALAAAAAGLARLATHDPFVAFVVERLYPRPPVPAATGAPERLTIDLARPAGEVDARFLSLMLDSALLVGGVWWSPEGEVGTGVEGPRIEPVDLGAPRLRRLARALAPAYLRVGGTEADRIHLALDGDAPPPPGFAHTLGAARWAELVAFIRAADLDLFLTLPAGPGTRDAEGAWTPRDARRLLDHARRRSDPIAVLELGNEANLYFSVFGLRHRVTGARYAADFARFRALARELAPQARVVGPASAYWPLLGELYGPFALLEGFLAEVQGPVDAMTWHWFPQQSRRCPAAVRRAAPERLLHPGHLDEAARWMRAIADHRDRHAPGTPLWMGEVGNAQCGGEPGVSDRYVATLWWLDQLGLAAREGQQVVVRQGIVGSDYGLLDPTHLTPRPDYWASLLWQRLMGPRVLRLERSGDDPWLRAYAHCAADRPSGPGGPNELTLLLLNVHPDRPAEARLAQLAGARVRRFALSAPALDSRTLHLNGEPLALGPGDELPALAGEEGVLDAEGTVRVGAREGVFVGVGSPASHGLLVCHQSR